MKIVYHGSPEDSGEFAPVRKQQPSELGFIGVLMGIIGAATLIALVIVKLARN